MIRRHFFLVGAVVAVLLMLLVGGLKLAFGGKATGQGGAAGGRAVAAHSRAHTESALRVARLGGPHRL